MLARWRKALKEHSRPHGGAFVHPFHSTLNPTRTAATPVIREYILPLGRRERDKRLFHDERKYSEETY
ncbi:hypothetical protein EYF80_004662 [Liparis tanakae]|uniref:Uncharacterized protein n=1 Tax=Liparis tanakae TaxID=230148 RepID=A0A4Z2J5S2_9TELE|nr:hypothetical protein EYF80_004662 [Liparis tanakae]